MTESPFVGLPALDPWTCGYGNQIDEPLCGAPPAVHLRVDCGWGPNVALAACAEHRSIAAAAGRVTGEHVFRSPACAEGTCLWIEDEHGA